MGIALKVFLCLLLNVVGSYGILDLINIDCPAGKQCLRIPQDCAEDFTNKCDCQAIVIVEKFSTSLLSFEMKRIGHGYIAMGISKDTDMKDDIIVGCAKEVHSLWSLKGGVTSSPPDGSKPVELTDPWVKTYGNILTCTFGITPPFVFKNMNFTYDTPHHLFASMGRADSTDPYLTYHAKSYAKTDFIIWNTTQFDNLIPAIPIKCLNMSIPIIRHNSTISTTTTGEIMIPSTFTSLIGSSSSQCILKSFGIQNVIMIFFWEYGWPMMC